MTTPGGARTTLGDSCLQQTSCARPTDLSHRVGAPTAPKLRGSDLLSQIETFVTLCGMVWVRAKVLGQMGWTTSPYLRAGALSCPSLAIYGLGSCGAPAFSRSAPPRCHCVSYVHKGNRVVYIRNPMSHRGPDRGPPASIGVGRCCLACLAEVLVSKSACQPVSPLCLETTYA
jgi:hypothetical protein